MVANWIEHVRVVEIPSGCLYISSAVEFDDQPGPVRDALVERVQIWQRALRRAITQAVDCGHLRADTDAAQLVYEIHGILLALHHDARLMRSRASTSRARHAVERLMTSYTSEGHAR